MTFGPGEMFSRTVYTRDYLNNELLPKARISQISLLIYQGNTLTCVSDSFLKEFEYPRLPPGEIDAQLWHLPEERLRFLENIRKTGISPKVENDDYLVLSGKKQETLVRIQFYSLAIKDQEPACVCLIVTNPPGPSFEDGIKGFSDEIFHNICDNSLNGIVLVNDRLELIYANQAAVEIYGYDSYEELSKVPILNSIAPESLKLAAERARNRIIGLTNPPILNYKIIRKDGKIRDVEVRASTIHVNGVKCHLNSIIDITERCRMEKALAESERMYRLLAENVSDIIWTADMDWSPTYISPSVTSMMGYNVEEAMELGREGKFLTPESLEMARKIFAYAVANASDGNPEPTEGYTLELQAKHKNGSLIWIEICAGLIRDANGKIKEILGVTRDITKRKQVEGALAETERRLQFALKEEVRHLRFKDLSQPYGADATYHQYPSQATKIMLEEAKIAANSDGNLLILGKSGVGKNYLAAWIHRNSARSDGPFFDVNCASITPSLVESELFGHEAGSFTGSRGRKRGLLELADGGTLFLDEIADMDLALQSKLLTFMDTHTLRRIGGETSIKVNSRIIAATNRTIENLVRSGQFREDLYYRLNVITIRVPSLSERREDIPLLAGEILKRLAWDMGLKETPVLGTDILKSLMKYNWPGNVRELKNVLERILLRTAGKPVISDVSMLNFIDNNSEHGESGVNFNQQSTGKGVTFQEAIQTLKRQMITEALAKSKTKSEAASSLGITRDALNHYIKSLGIKKR